MLLRRLIFEIDTKVDILWSDDLVICFSVHVNMIFLSINSEEISVFVDDYLFNSLREHYLDGVGYALYHLQVSYLFSDYLRRDRAHPIERDTHFDLEDVLEVGLRIEASDMHEAVGLKDFVE